MVEAIKVVDEITKGETCRRSWGRPVREIWWNTHLTVEREQMVSEKDQVVSELGRPQWNSATKAKAERILRLTPGC